MTPLRTPAMATEAAGPGATIGGRPTRPTWLRRRLLWLVPGIAIGLLAGIQATEHGVGILVLLAAGIVPHLPVLLGLGRPHAPGQLPARAVPLYNAFHHPVLPLLVLGLAAAGVLSPVWLVVGLAWLSHIVVDLAMDHGLRTADGFRKPWWALR